VKFSKKDKLEIVENAISWVVVLAMFVYGGAKPLQFNGAAEVDTVISEATGMQLMWAFYGYSQAFAIIIGVLEVLGGVLILIRRTRIIGCLFTSTILVNIILQDIFYEVNQGALRAAILYQLILFVILWLNREKLIASLKDLLIVNETEGAKAKLFVKLLIAFAIFAALRVLEYYATTQW